MYGKQKLISDNDDVDDADVDADAGADAYAVKILIRTWMLRTQECIKYPTATK